MSEIRTIGFVLFDGVERLDYEGPLGVLGWARRQVTPELDIKLYSVHGNPVTDHLSQKSVFIDGSTRDIESVDLLIVPGGNLSDFINDEALVAEVRRLGLGAKIVAAVCVGAFLVAKAGLANGKSLVTHWYSHPRFKQEFPGITLVEDQRFYTDGNLWSSAGISAGIDMTLRLVASVWTPKVAKVSQGFMEYFPEPPYNRQEVIDARRS